MVGVWQRWDVSRVVILVVTIAAVGSSGCADSPVAPSLSTASSASFIPSPSLVVYESEADGVSLPVVISRVSPRYTSAALGNQIQGAVLLSAVVWPDGTVGQVNVTRSLDTVYGLDKEAVIAVRRWLFMPGLKDGVAVAVRVTFEISFSIRF